MQIILNKILIIPFVNHIYDFKILRKIGNILINHILIIKLFIILSVCKLIICILLYFIEFQILTLFSHFSQIYY